MSVSGLKDIDREILKHVSDKELLKICSVDRKTWNEVCDDTFLRRRLTNKYPDIEKYKKENESWKEFYLRAVYYISKMQEKYKFSYINGDFKQQYEMLKFYKRKWELLIEASKMHEPSLIKYAVQRGADIHTYDDFALSHASQLGNLELVKFLVEHGANIHAGDDRALALAADQGKLEVVKYLIEKGAHVNAHNNAALKLASARGHVHVVKYLQSL